MVSQAPLIEASLVSSIYTGTLYGRGVVDKKIDDSTFIIRMPSDNITVKVTQGSLSVGDVVAVIDNGESISIQKVNAPLKSGGDLLDVQLANHVKELLENLKELQRVLPSNQDDNETARQLDSAIQLLKKNDLTVSSLQEAINQLKNDLATKIDIVNANLDSETVNRIMDRISLIMQKIFNLSGININSNSAGESQIITLSESPEAGMHYAESLQDALAAILKYSKNLTYLEQSTEKMLEKFEDKPLFIRFFNSAKSAPKAVVIPLEKALVEIEHILHYEMKSNVIKQLNPSVVMDALIQRGSINQSLLSGIDNILISMSPEDRVAVLKEDALRITLPQLVAVAHDLGENKLSDLGIVLTRVGSEIPGSVMEIYNLLKNSDFDYNLSSVKEILSENLSIDNIERNEDFLPSLFKKMGFSLEYDIAKSSELQPIDLSEKISSVKLDLLFLLAHINTMIHEKERIETGLSDFKTTLSRINSQIPDLAHEIVELLEKNSNDVELKTIRKLLFEGIPLEKIDTVQKKQDFLTTLFKDMAFSSERDATTSHYQTSYLNKESPGIKLALFLIYNRVNPVINDKEVVERDGLAREIISMLDKTERQLTSQRTGINIERDALTHLRTPSEMIRQQVENVLSRIEALQILAKPVITSEGEQQVLALPINIGGEWTEVRLKFLKKRSEKNGRKKTGHISVVINIDLKLLGEITACMEYITNKSLDISLSFDNARSVKWFQKNMNEFNKSLKELGIPSVKVKIDDSNIQKIDSTTLLPKSKYSGTSFDILG